MINFAIANGRGEKRTASVDVDGCVGFVEHPRPPFGGRTTMRVFRQHLTDDGLATDGTNQDMRVIGTAASPIDFYVPASETRDRYISKLSFVIADQNAALNQFGNLTALTNGCQLLYSDELGTVTIHEALKSNFNFVRLCHGNPPFRGSSVAFRANNVSGNSEGYLPVLDLQAVFGFRWGLRLAVGTNQRITMRIRDDVSGVDQFDCIAYGFERLA